MHRASISSQKRLAAGFAAILFSATLVAQPANDECANATPLVDGITGSTAGATTSSPIWPCAIGGNDVWFVWTAPATGTLTVDSCDPATSYDTALRIFDGGCGALNPLACNDDFCLLQSSVTVPVIQGTEYHVNLGGFAGSVGNYHLNVCLVPTYVGSGTITAGPFSNCQGSLISNFTVGNPNLGGTVTSTLVGGSGAGFTAWGFVNGPTPLTTLVDTPCPCILLLGSNVVWYFSSSVSVTIPCGPFWVGKVLKTQNVDLFGAGPVCPLPVPGSMTDITHVLIGS